MNTKKFLPVLSLMAALVLTGCGGTKDSSKKDESSKTPTSETISKTSSKDSSAKPSSTESSAKPSSSSTPAPTKEEHTWVADGEKQGVVQKEKCTDAHACGKEAYHLAVNDATGWNKGTTKMNGKTAPNNEAKWDISGIVPNGKYTIELNCKMSYSTHSNRYWENHAKFDHPDDGNPPDSTSEDDYRYGFKLDGGDLIPANSGKSWGEDGLEGDNDGGQFHYVAVASNVEITDVAAFSLYHCNIGYSLIIQDVRLILTEKGAPTVKDEEMIGDSKYTWGKLIEAEGNSAYKAGKNAEENQAIKIAADQDLNGKLATRGAKFAANGDEAEYKFNLAKGFAGKLMVRLCADQNSNLNKKFYYGKINGSPAEKDTTNIEFSANGQPIVVENHDTWEANGVTGSDEEHSAIVFVGYVSLDNGVNSIKMKRVDSYAPCFFDVYVVEAELPSPTPVEHECEHVCEFCGKCTDATCEDPKCAEKCTDLIADFDENGKAHFEAENATSLDNCSVAENEAALGGKLVGGFNFGASATYEIYAHEAVKVYMDLRGCLGQVDNGNDNRAYELNVNDSKIGNFGPITAEAGWHDYKQYASTEFDLVKGKNVVKIICPFDSHTNVDAFDLVIAKHVDAFTYGDPVVKEGESTYAIGTCDCGKKDVKISVAEDLNGKLTARPKKFGSNGDEAKYLITVDSAMYVDLSVLGGVDSYSANKNYGLHTGKNGGSSAVTLPDGKTNLTFKVNGVEVAIDNNQTYAQMGMLDGGDKDEAKAGMAYIGKTMLVKGQNEITIKRNDSFAMTMYDLHLTTREAEEIQSFGFDDMVVSGGSTLASGDVKYVKLGSSGNTITIKYTAAAAQTAMLRFLVTTKASNIGSAGVWRQGSDAQSKFAITVNDADVPVPMDSTTLQQLGATNAADPSGVKDGGSAEATPIWVDFIAVNLIQGENTIVIKYQGSGYSLVFAGLALAK